MSKVDMLISNVNIASMDDNGAPYGQILNTCVAVSEGKIVSVGEHTQARHHVDAQSGWLTPGLVDCHTHLLFAGDRAEEFEQRLQGVSYADIAKRGGGIASTVNATRHASADALFESGKQRLQTLLNEGVTTVEIKSGYGLDLDTEQRLLRVATELNKAMPQCLSRTYLGAHALPPEFSSADDYIDFVTDKVLPELHDNGLVDAVDVFCEGIGFSPAQCEKVYQAAHKLGLPIKAHVEQLSDLKGAKLASHYQALSVDHIEYLQPEDIPSIKQAGTVAVLLPGAFYFLRETQLPPIEALRQHSVPMAIASDFNPGSSPICSLLTIMNMACVLFRLTPEEVLKGVTRHAAQALGMPNKGIIAPGKDADMVLWDMTHPAQLVASMGQIRPQHVWIGGQPCR
ncbi:imidazolonepropionase [Aestuariibacter salexigens]|uniref:imidazolonepropionase n=1 Tax=Aestuariibacter salexigens TaxID=226010 RepID=UPI0004045DE7|nr:imidazolonepropionase [Aestuariibacter salexigens]